MSRTSLGSRGTVGSSGNMAQTLLHLSLGSTGCSGWRRSYRSDCSASPGHRSARRKCPGLVSDLQVLRKPCDTHTDLICSTDDLLHLRRHRKLRHLHVHNRLHGSGLRRVLSLRVRRERLRERLPGRCVCHVRYCESCP